MKKIFAVFVVLLFCGVCFAGSGPYPNKQFGQDLGKDGRSYGDLYLKNKIIFEGATSNGYEGTISVPDVAADYTWTFPSKTGTIALLTQTITAKVQTDSPVTVSSGDAGQIYDNTGAGGAVVFNLPEASTVIGKSFTFCVTAAQNLDVNPANGDKILGLTNAAGDAIRNATLGGSITLTVLDAANIVATAYQGTWSDVN